MLYCKLDWSSCCCKCFIWTCSVFFAVRRMVVWSARHLRNMSAWQIYVVVLDVVKTRWHALSANDPENRELTDPTWRKASGLVSSGKPIIISLLCFPVITIFVTRLERSSRKSPNPGEREVKSVEEDIVFKVFIVVVARKDFVAFLVRKNQFSDCFSGLCRSRLQSKTEISRGRLICHWQVFIYWDFLTSSTATFYVIQNSNSLKYFW